VLLKEEKKFLRKRYLLAEGVQDVVEEVAEAAGAVCKQEQWLFLFTKMSNLLAI
jgi:hypothetical protein